MDSRQAAPAQFQLNLTVTAPSFILLRKKAIPSTIWKFGLNEIHMVSLALKRQLITDAEGNPVGVILPLAEYALVEKFLERHSDQDKLLQLERAVSDPLFIADLQETMSAFAETDLEWWEPDQ